MRYLYFKNPSGQDQWADHFWPSLAKTLLLLTTPVVVIYLGLGCVLHALYVELIRDEHWRDLFTDTPGGADGRIDLFFRLAGSGLAFATRLWN